MTSFSILTNVPALRASRALEQTLARSAASGATLSSGEKLPVPKTEAKTEEVRGPKPIGGEPGRFLNVIA